MMSSASLEFPPLNYTLLFRDRLNFHMQRNPYFPIFTYRNEVFPNSNVEISMLEFGRAAHRVAHALRPFLEGPDGELVMVIANTDNILYQAVVAGLSIAGWVPFPVSPRNSVAAVVSMMKKTNCSRIVTLDHAHGGLIGDIRRENGGGHLSIYELPTLRYAFPKLGQEQIADAFIPYPSTVQRPDLDSPAIYMHSSGSTGFPKPIAHSHRIQIQWLTHPMLGVDAKLPAPRRIGAMALPPFHASGIVTQLYIPIAYLVTVVVYPPRTWTDPLAQPVIPTSDNILDCLKGTQCNILISVPTFLEQMATSDEAVGILKNVSVRFGGGPLPIKVGDALWAAGVQLSSLYSGTEFGSPISMPNEQEFTDGDWMWMRFLEDIKIRWEPQGHDTYELQILSTPDRQMAVENLPDVKGYATADLFVRHPTKDLWKIVGRVDDVIVLATGEKTVPALMESSISSSPLVQGVVMFGRERNQVGVIIEPCSGHAVDIDDEGAVAEFRNRIWPTIEEANKTAPTFSRIFKEMILLTSHDKPMLRTAKGTLQRKATLNAYEAEINALYDAVEASQVAPDGLAAPSAWTSAALGEWFLGHACAINSNNCIDAGVDLFVQGFDSLSATHLRNRLMGALRRSLVPEINKAAMRIPLNIVFEYPTIQLLSARVAALVNEDGTGQTVDFMEQHTQAITAMIEEYCVGLNGPADGILPNSGAIVPAVVLLTGTTGGLGSFLLSELIKNPSVQRIFAFNRPRPTKSIEERQRSAFRDRSLQTELLDSNKLVYVEADASSEKCGMSTAQYEEIRSSITVIIHNAWRLDFNLALYSFKENVRATRNLVDLGLDSVHNKRLRFVFVSSVGLAQSWDNTRGPFPEEVQFDPHVAVGTGYGESKYVAERIVTKSGLGATSLRVGQISGGPGGSWATADWFPILVRSSVTLGAFPVAAGVASWLRTEDVAAVVLETAFARETPPPVLNVVNPRSVPFATTIASVRSSIIKRKALGDPEDVTVLPIVPFQDWCLLLENKAEQASEGELTDIPAIRLLKFFRNLAQGDQSVRRLGTGLDVTEMAGMATVSTSKAQRVSPTMANMKAIGDADADAWVEYWISKGAL